MSVDQGRKDAHLPPDDERRLWLALVEQSAKTDALQAELSAMQNSASWRVTAPLRALRGLLRRDKSVTGKITGTVERSELSGSATVELLAWMAALLPEAESDIAPRWLVDVTELSREDLGAGVERVTRRLLGELLLAPPSGVRIQPVRLSPAGEYLCANQFLARFVGVPAGSFGADTSAHPRLGDHFIGLDFCRSYAKPFARALSGMRDTGVPVSLLVHDMLPMTHPQWFPEGVPRDFEAWLRTLSLFADRALCNSHCTAQELAKVLAQKGLMAPQLQKFVIPLGADFPPAPWVGALPPKDGCDTCRVLTVGTVEPRKGHAQALEAFEALWRDGAPFHWIIAGKPGWNVELLVERLRQHPEQGRRLHWLKGPDDRVLASLYRECDVLLAPSFGEGYGLPVAEAGRMGTPLLLRDLPIFREVAGERAQYFSGEDPQVLAKALLDWSKDTTTKGHEALGQWGTWAQSAAELKRICVASPKDASIRIKT